LSLKYKFGNLLLFLAMSVLYIHRILDLRSGMRVFRRSILEDFRLTGDGLTLSEEVRIEALMAPGRRFGEIAIR
jgi:hypothetical protein